MLENKKGSLVFFVVTTMDNKLSQGFMRDNPLLLCFVQFYDKFINQKGYKKKCWV